MTKRKFLWLFGKHYTQLVRAAAKVHGTQNAQDITQEALARVLEKKGYIGVEGTNNMLRSWLFCVVINQAKNMRKRDEFTTAVLADHAQEQQRAAFVGTRTVIRSAPDNEDYWAGLSSLATPAPIPGAIELTRADVRLVLAELSPTDRQIVHGILMGNETLASMAELSGLSSAFISTRLAYLRAFLRGKLGAYKVGKPLEKTG